MADENHSSSSTQGKGEANKSHNPYVLPRLSNTPEVARSAKLTDQNQYAYFYEEMGDSLQPNEGQTFPISHKSEEAEKFERYVSWVARYLDGQKFPWESINCMGRVNEVRRIQSTIMVGAATLQRSPTQASLPDLKKDIMEKTCLPVEFVEGTNELEAPFEFRQPSTPLVSGVSCGNVSKKVSSGTIGGFIEHRRNATTNDIYAVSNHHVFAVGQDAVSFREFAKRPEVSRLLESLERLRRFDSERLADELIQLSLISCSRSIEEHFRSPEYRTDNKDHYLRLLKSVTHTSGDDPGSTSKPNSHPLRAFGGLKSPKIGLFASNFEDTEGSMREKKGLEGLSECGAVFGFGKVLLTDLNTFSSYWGQPPIQADRFDSALETLLRSILQINSLQHTELMMLRKFVDSPEGMSRLPTSFEDVTRQILIFNLGRMVLDSLISSLYLSWGKTRGVADALEIIYLMHHENALEGLDNLLIEHPSRPDQRYLTSRVKNEMEESNSSHIEYTPKEEKSRDIIKLQSQLAEAKEIETNPLKRVIGYVWTSSGLSTKLDRRFGGGHVREDWALVRLLPDFKEYAKSRFDQNMLRPDFHELGAQSFTQACAWLPSKREERLMVVKRGRSSNYTVGNVNGARGLCKLPDGRKVSEGGENYTLEFNIISVPKSRLFSEPGDSGSWIMNKAGEFVGMMWGKLADKQSTAFTPGPYLLSWWKDEICPKTATQKENEEVIYIL